MSDKTVRRPIRWESAQDTNVGAVREVNEDSIFTASDVALWAVADGMGGYEAGNIASNMIVTALEHVAERASLSALVESVEDCLIDVHNRILEYADIMLDGRTFGSTVVTLMIKGRVGVCMWAGDSRLYRLRHKELVQISRDHSQVEELVQQGFLSKEEAEDHPESNVITRAVGVGSELCLEVTAFDVQQGDVFLLCSDGLYNMVSHTDIGETLLSCAIDDAVDRLIQMALDRGATDNVSVVIVKGVQAEISAPTSVCAL